MTDYSYYNQAFADGLAKFLDYTDPYPFKHRAKNSLLVQKTLSKREFEKRSIQRWAISELLEAIMDDPWHPIEDITYRFALKLCSFELTANDPMAKNIFHIAAEFIDKEVINLFRRKEGVYP